MLRIRVKQIDDDELEITILSAKSAGNDKLTTSEDHTHTVVATHQERRAATELTTFLKDGRRSASECVEFLKGAGFNVEVMNFGRVRKCGDIGHWQREGKSWWALRSLSGELAEMAESCDDWFDVCLAEGSELIEEDYCGYIG